MYVIIEEGVSADPEMLGECIQLLLSGPIPIADVKDELLATFRLQTEKDAACGRRTFVKEISRILSLFFSFPKLKGKGSLSRSSFIAEAYRALSDPEGEQ